MINKEGSAQRVRTRPRVFRSECRISANINEFFAEVATGAETAMLDALGRRNIADSLAEMLRLDAIRMKRVTITANAAE
jgi:Rrf2 family transcriptional repressor of oqxAB